MLCFADVRLCSDDVRVQKKLDMMYQRYYNLTVNVNVQFYLSADASDVSYLVTEGV